MSVELVPRDEGGGAAGAGVGRLARVQPLVPLQVRRAAELALAHGALVRRLARVDALVVPQVGHLREGGAADVAAVGPLARVQAAVAHQVRPLLELAAAVLAVEATLPVDRERRPRCEGRRVNPRGLAVAHVARGRAEDGAHGRLQG